MPQGKKLRYADMIRFSGGGEGALALGESYGPNSLMPGVVSPATRLDHLDNALATSQPSCSNRPPASMSPSSRAGETSSSGAAPRT